MRPVRSPSLNGLAQLAAALAAALAAYGLMTFPGATAFPAALAGAIAGGWVLGRVRRGSPA